MVETIGNKKARAFDYTPMATPTGVEGRSYYDSTGKVIKVYDGSVWATLSTGVTASMTDLQFQHLIVNAINDVNQQMVAPYAYMAPPNFIKDIFATSSQIHGSSDVLYLTNSKRVFFADTYDDFNDGVLDAAKWQGANSYTDASNYGLYEEAGGYAHVKTSYYNGNPSQYAQITNKNDLKAYQTIVLRFNGSTGGPTGSSGTLGIYMVGSTSGSVGLYVGSGAFTWANTEIQICINTASNNCVVYVDGSTTGTTIDLSSLVGSWYIQFYSGSGGSYNNFGNLYVEYMFRATSATTQKTLITTSTTVPAGITVACPYSSSFGSSADTKVVSMSITGTPTWESWSNGHATSFSNSGTSLQTRWQITPSLVAVPTSDTAMMRWWGVMYN